MEVLVLMLAAGGGVALLERGRRLQERAEELEAVVHQLSCRLGAMEDRLPPVRREPASPPAWWAAPEAEAVGPGRSRRARPGPAMARVGEGLSTACPATSLAQPGGSPPPAPPAPLEAGSNEPPASIEDAPPRPEGRVPGPAPDDSRATKVPGLDEGSGTCAGSPGDLPEASPELAIPPRSTPGLPPPLANPEAGRAPGLPVPLAAPTAGPAPRLPRAAPEAGPVPDPEQADPDPDPRALVELPGWTAAWDEKASPAELAFAGHYLNLAGLVVLGLGAMSLLKLTWSGGVLQCLAGLALGGLLLVAGDRFHRQGLQRYSHPMLAAGFALLLLTVCAGHFYFGLVGRGVLFGAMAGLVAASGLAALRYDSRAIADTMLAALFLGPFFMTFRLEQLGTVVAYLMAVSVGTTWVALHKKWDFQLIAAFLGSYALFFHHFQLRHPAETMAFLAVTYALFLTANHLNHFRQRSSSGYNLVLSFVNPVALAVVSYFVLLRLPNAVALGTYAAIGLVHLGLAALARHRAARDASFRDLVTANLAMGLLFLSASVSFITYFSTNTNWFSLVTLLWFGQGFLLQAAAGRLPDVAPMLRRYGYLGLLLAGTQLAVVIPTMEDTSPHVLSEKLLLNLAGAGLFFAWFLLVRRSRPRTGEERLAMRLSAWASAALVAWLALAPLDPVLTPVASAALALAALAVGFRFPEDLGGMRYPAVLLAVGALHGGGVGGSLPTAAAVAALLLAAGGLLRQREEELPLRERALADLLQGAAGALVLKAAWLAGGLVAVAGAAVALAAAPLAPWPAVAGLGALAVTTVGLLGGTATPTTSLLLAALVAATGALLARRPEWDPRVGAFAAAGMAGALLLKEAWLAGGGAGIVAGTATAALLMAASLRWSALAEMRNLADLLAVVLGPAALVGPDAPRAQWFAAGLLALGAATLLRHRERLPEAERAAPALWILAAAMPLGRLALEARTWDLGATLVAGAALAAALSWLSRRPWGNLQALAPAAWTVAAATTLLLLVLPLEAGPLRLGLVAAACALLAASAKADRPGWPVGAGLACAGLLKLLLLLASGPAATLLWALAGLALLVRRPDLGRAALFLAFLKSVAMDGAFVAGKGGMDLAPTGTLTLAQGLASVALVACLLLAARLSRGQVEVRNGFTLMALTAFAFRSAHLMYDSFGVLDNFQVLLSAFWCTSAFLVITWGIHREVKVFRLFGLTILVASALKIAMVDLWVLNAYSKTGTLLILGALLMAVSFLYQCNRVRLEAAPLPEPA